MIIEFREAGSFSTNYVRGPRHSLLRKGANFGVTIYASPSGLESNVRTRMHIKRTYLETPAFTALLPTHPFCYFLPLIQ